MKVVILASGNGQRFKDCGFTVPKVMLPVPTQNGIKTLYNAVVGNVEQIFDNITEFIIVKRKEHVYNVETDKKVTFIDVEQTTGGAACSLLLAKDLIDGYEPVLVVNSDQLIEVDIINFKTLFNIIERNHSLIFTFNLNKEESKWSFVKLDGSSDVELVAEKQQISNLATCGLYYFDFGNILINGLSNMMDDEKNKYNNEWYLAPVYNFITSYSKVFNVDKMHGLGTPEDYIKYLNDMSYDYNKETNKLISIDIKSEQQKN